MQHASNSEMLSSATITTDLGRRMMARHLRKTTKLNTTGTKYVLFTSSEWKIKTKPETKRQQTDQFNKKLIASLKEISTKSIHKETIPSKKENKSISYIFDNLSEYEIPKNTLFIKSKVENQKCIDDDIQLTVVGSKERKDNLQFQQDPFEWRHRESQKKDLMDGEEDFYPEAYDTSYQDFESSSKRNPNYRRTNAKHSQSYSAIQQVMKQKYNKEI